MFFEKLKLSFINIGDRLKSKSNKIKIFISALLILIILLIFFSSFKTGKKTNNVETINNASWMEYCEKQENRLKYVLGQIKGLENVNVFIMTESSPTIKYLEETKTENVVKEQNTTTSIETKIVMSKDGSMTTPVVVVEVLPKITGVLIVAKGVNNSKLKATLINSVSAILDVKVSCIEILEGK